MARININESLDADPRFRKLVRITGDYRYAIGMVVEFWRVAQKHWGNDRSLVPFDEFEDGDFEPLLRSRLAIKRETGIYAAGAEEHFAWYLSIKQSAKLGGQKSAEARRLKNGHAIPANAKNSMSTTEPSLRSDPPFASVLPNPLSLSPSLALAQQDKVNTATSSSNHSTHNNPPPVRSRSATSPEKRIGFKATKAAVKVIGTMQLIGERENEAARALGEDIYAALLSKYPVNTWGQVCASYRAMASKGRESFFEADLVRLFESHFWEGEVPDRGPAGMTTQASLPVAPGSRKVGTRHDNPA